MRGEMKIRRGKYASEIKLYRCAAAKEPGVECPGTQVSGPRRTTVRADETEARFDVGPFGEVTAGARNKKLDREKTGVAGLDLSKK